MQTSNVPKNQERIVGYITIGTLIVLGGLLFATSIERQVAANQTARTMIEYVSHRQTDFVATDLTASLKAGDQVFFEPTSGPIVQAGFIERIEINDGNRIAHIHWHVTHVPVAQCRFVAHQNRGCLDDVTSLMLPLEKRQRIERIISISMQAHGDRITANLSPFFEHSMRDSLPAIESGLKASIERHRSELDALASRWNDEILEQRLLPLAKQEIVPIVRQHSEPVAQKIGRELWERASIWSFTWRAIYDKSPLPQKDLMKDEWDRFVEEEAIPVIEAHAAEIATAIQQTMLEVAENEKVRTEMSDAADAIASDPTTRSLLKTVLRESIVDNLGLRKVWSDTWTSPEAQAALKDAGNLLEPMIRQIGDELMGTREAGIDPGFARLLRNQILQKDKRWVMAIEVNDKTTQQPPSETPVIKAATVRAVFPMPTLARTDEPND